MDKETSSSDSAKICEEHHMNEIEDVENVDCNAMDNVVNKGEMVEVPKVGMIFNNYEELYQYYKSYGQQMGFGVRKRTSMRGDDGKLRYVTFSCAKAGNSKSNSTNLFRPYPVKRTNCKALIRASASLDGNWRVNTIVLDHNHGLSPNKTSSFRCNWTMSPLIKRKLELNDRENYNSFVVEEGGYENVSFLERDCRNYIHKLRQLRLSVGDAIAIQKYFLKMQVDNSNFFCTMDLDEEGCLRNVFWADARSKAAYEEFGDVVTFDTTYLTKKYNMPFAPFVGVNHHGHSMLLGCGLISNEDTETFTWLFESWLACMSGRPPSAIITDQDKTMKKGN